MNKDEVERVLYEKLGWCGCGHHDDALEYLKLALETIDDKWRRIRALPEESRAEHQAKLSEICREVEGVLGLDKSPGVVTIFLYVLSGAKWIEHGGSVNGAWLTEDGENVLKALKEHWTELAEV